LGERRTADPSASLGMTKWRVVAFIKSSQIGWTERKQQAPHCTSLRMTILREFRRKTS
jgi:hypothetical protein